MRKHYKRALGVEVEHTHGLVFGSGRYTSSSKQRRPKHLNDRPDQTETSTDESRTRLGEQPWGSRKPDIQEPYFYRGEKKRGRD